MTVSKDEDDALFLSTRFFTVSHFLKHLMLYYTYEAILEFTGFIIYKILFIELMT